MKSPLCVRPLPLIALLTLSASLPMQAKTPRHSRAAPLLASATITNSGSGSLPGYRIRVTANGHLASVTLLHNGRVSGGRTGLLVSPVTQRFFSDLAHASPVSALPVLPQLTNAPAPGVRITIRYRGQQSPDLRQAQSEAGRTLYQDALQIIQVLRLPVPNTP